MRTITGKVHTV